MHLDREIENLKARTLTLAARVEDALRSALLSVKDRDPEAARRVIAGDEVIDQLEVELEEECLKALALYQPVAIDLRFIISIIKVTNELERIGDLATDIAERSVFLADLPPEPPPPHLQELAARVQAMVGRALDSLVQSDPKAARDVCRADDEVDRLHASTFAFVETALARERARVEVLLPYLSISRYLERIGDHATNIAEDVIYSVEGRIVRHQGGPETEQTAPAD